ncbi:SERTA domain-containing protein 4 [Salarias fasciatus]|uniref:SERTA domain-containing protein n=1 Tax=Salarias fasciatus TaxID=181472 RepID=A0A672J8Z9_SALFA|nr:SERTA domain-containing protein 4 [Salarias fasciatus]
MTLVLSMNPFLDPEGDPPLSPYQPIWESERCTKTCLSNPAPPCSSEEQFTQEAPCRRVPDHVSVSRIAYFKRKFVEDEDEPPFSFRTYCQTVAPVLEERAHVLRLSLEKMRFIDDPEAFLRRSVLVNNLLRRLRAEILLQSTDWCFPPNPAFAASPCVLPPSATPTLHRAVPARICLAPQAGPPFRKRFRMLRGGQGDLRPDCAQTCCCIYAAAAAAGHYLHLPLSMYDAALSSCPSSPHSSSFFQLAGHSKLGLAVDDQDDEDEEVEEEEEEEEEENEEEREEEDEEEDDDERRLSEDVRDKHSRKSRTRTLPGRARARTADSSMTESLEEEVGEQEDEEEVEEEEEVGQVERPCQWNSPAPERELHKVSFWQRRAQRQ